VYTHSADLNSKDALGELFVAYLFLKANLKEQELAEPPLPTLRKQQNTASREYNYISARWESALKDLIC
jgi:hypothetical protein